MPISFTFSTDLSGADAAAAGAAALRDKALDPNTGDLAIVNGDQTYTSDISGIAANLKANWLFVKGEWFLDLDKGVDYWGVIFAKGTTLAAMEEEFKREALATVGVAAAIIQVTKLPGRVLDVQGQITTDTGLIFKAALGVNAGS